MNKRLTPFALSAMRKRYERPTTHAYIKADINNLLDHIAALKAELSRSRKWVSWWEKAAQGMSRRCEKWKP